MLPRQELGRSLPQNSTMRAQRVRSDLSGCVLEARAERLVRRVSHQCPRTGDDNEWLCVQLVELELQIWWPRAELNHRHTDFQSAALPTELLGRSEKQDPAAWAKSKDFTRSRSTDRTGSRTLTGSQASHRPLHPAPPRPENGPKPARVPAHRLQRFSNRPAA